jgi:uncharacterized protein involved in cysteine biosynthesis
MRPLNRLHRYHWSKEIVHTRRVKNRILFSLCGLIPILFLVLIPLAACVALAFRHQDQPFQL